MTYSGPTAIFIKSGKHDSSTATTHADDFDVLVSLDNFKDIACTKAGLVKPVVVITVDGGPDENLRYSKTLNVAYKGFREYNLDALHVVCHASGHSSYSAVERRMTLLSHDLSGPILPHYHFVSHLNASGKTIDAALDKANFKKAGETLAEIWGQTVIDGYSVHAVYVEPNSTSISRPTPNIQWCNDHVQQSQYFAFKCSDAASAVVKEEQITVTVSQTVSSMCLNLTLTPITSAAIGSSSATYGSLFHRLALWHLHITTGS